MTSTAQIPIIDIASNDDAKLADKLVEAAIEHGFIYVKNLGHDISPAQIEGAFSVVSPPPPFLRHPYHHVRVSVFYFISI